MRQAPVPLGEAIVTPAGNLAAHAVIHAVSLDRDRRTSGPVIANAVRWAYNPERRIADPNDVTAVEPPVNDGCSLSRLAI